MKSALKRTMTLTLLGALAGFPSAFAQEPSLANEPERIAADEPVSGATVDQQNDSLYAQSLYSQNVPRDPGGWRRLGQGPDGDRRPAGPPPAFDSRGLPPELTVPAGTFITIRVNEPISSDHTQPGQPFTASLVKPIVVDGRIVADRGQTIAGRVAAAKKAGFFRGTSQLAIELTELSIVDGSQIPLRSQLIAYQGPTSIGRDATAVGTTTGLGAAIGAIAAGGSGAAMGAGAGAGAAIIGVLLTRGRATIVYPESVLTFRIESPIVVATDRAPQAFRPVSQQDYDQPGDQPRTLVQRQVGPAPGAWGGWGGPYWGPGWGWGYPRYYYGPSLGIGFVYGRGFGRRGFGGPRFGGPGFGGRGFGRPGFGGRGFGRRR